MHSGPETLAAVATGSARSPSRSRSPSTLRCLATSPSEPNSGRMIRPSPSSQSMSKNSAYAEDRPELQDIPPPRVLLATMPIQGLGTMSTIRPMPATAPRITALGRQEPPSSRHRRRIGDAIAGSTRRPPGTGTDAIPEVVEVVQQVLGIGEGETRIRSTDRSASAPGKWK